VPATVERTAVNGTALREVRQELKGIVRLARDAQIAVARLSDAWPEEAVGVYVIDADEEFDGEDLLAFVLAARAESPERNLTITVTAHQRADRRKP